MNDLEFVRKCASGDTRSWNQFVDKYSRLIYSAIHHVFRLKSPRYYSPQVLEDTFQDIFLLLSRDDFRKLKSFKAKNGCSFAGWLRQVVINYTIDCLRKDTYLVSLDQEDEEGVSIKDALPQQGADSLQQLERKEGFSGLKECIEALESPDKLLLELHFNQGLIFEELKKIFRISRAAVDMRKARLMQRLRECFKQKGFQLDL